MFILFIHMKIDELSADEIKYMVKDLSISSYL